MATGCRAWVSIRSRLKAQIVGCSRADGRAHLLAWGCSDAASGARGCSLWRTGLQPLAHGVAASTARGCSLWCTGLQPPGLPAVKVDRGERAAVVADDDAVGVEHGHH